MQTPPDHAPHVSSMLVSRDLVLVERHLQLIKAGLLGDFLGQNVAAWTTASPSRQPYNDKISRRPKAVSCAGERRPRALRCLSVLCVQSLPSHASPSPFGWSPPRGCIVSCRAAASARRTSGTAQDPARIKRLRVIDFSSIVRHSALEPAVSVAVYPLLHIRSTQVPWLWLRCCFPCSTVTQRPCLAAFCFGAVLLQRPEAWHG